MKVDCETQSDPITSNYINVNNYNWVGLGVSSNDSIVKCDTVTINETLVLDRNDLFNKIYNDVTQKWVDYRMSGKICFLVSVSFILAMAVTLLKCPSGILVLYCIAFPLLLLFRLYSYIKTRSCLFLLDNCYFINIFLNLFLYIPQLSYSTVFRAIFIAINGPVLLAVIPYRNTLAFHDIDKLTSCFIHCIPAIVSWNVRWFPASTGKNWLRDFQQEDILLQPIYQWFGVPFDWTWFVLVPLLYLILHDFLYIIVVRGIIQPDNIYSDSFTYIRPRINLCGQKMEDMKLIYQIILFLSLTTSLYVVGNILAVLCFHHWLVHTIVVIIQSLIVIWNGGCYYLDYFAYLALRAHNNQSNRDLIT